jgi:hypothetical protein
VEMMTGERARLLEAADANCGEVTNHAKKLDVVFEATEQTRRNHATKMQSIRRQSTQHPDRREEPGVSIDSSWSWTRHVR